MILGAVFYIVRGEYNFVPINLVLGGVAAFHRVWTVVCEAHRARVDQHLVSHWFNTNADWRIIGSWREGLLIANYASDKDQPPDLCRTPNAATPCAWVGENEGGANPRKRTAPHVEPHRVLGGLYFFSNSSFKCLAHASAVVCCPCSVFFLFTA